MLDDALRTWLATRETGTEHNPPKRMVGSVKLLRGAAPTDSVARPNLTKSRTMQFPLEK
jgi:hypothetical protein